VVTAGQVIVGAMLSQHPVDRTLLHPLLDTCRQQLAEARVKPRMRHHRGRADYKLRAQTVEPVFGQIKTCMKMTTMSRRGVEACRSGWLLAATAHNLRKLHGHRRTA
jgi:hypothetical protein